MRGKLEAEASVTCRENTGCTRDAFVVQLNQALDHSAGDNREHAMTKNVSIFFGLRGVPARYYKERVMQADMNLAF